MSAWKGRATAHYLLRRLNLTTGAGHAAIASVWRAWAAAGNAPSPAALRRERRAWMEQHFQNRPKAFHQFESAVKMCAQEDLLKVLPLGSMPEDAELVRLWHFSCSQITKLSAHNLPA